MSYTKEKHHLASSRILRDERGRFIRSIPQSPEPKTSSFLDRLFKRTSVQKTLDDETLIDVHIGNPLRRITRILEEIKQQKAFSFNIKGSIGVAGVAAVLGTAGFFGGFNALCNKGVQSEIGLVRTLNFEQNSKEDVFIVSQVKDFLGMNTSKPLRKRTLLIKSGTSAINLLTAFETQLDFYNNKQVIATGNYNSCQNTLKLTSKNSIESY